MALQGLPDFATALAVEGATLFAPYDQRGSLSLTPGALSIAEAADGGPELRIETVRGRTPLLPPQPYAVLDLRLRAQYELQAALAVARAQIAEACVSPLTIGGGALRLGGGPLPDELRRSAPLAWNGLGMARCVFRISTETAKLLIDGLRGDVLPLHAHVDLAVPGVAPRVPCIVRFDPRVLLQALRAEAEADGGLAYSEFEALFRREVDGLPFVVEGELGLREREALAVALCDRTLQRFARLVAPPDDGGEPWVAIEPLDSLGPGRFTWDLSEAQQVTRPLTLRLDPFTAARDAVAARGLAAVVRDTIVPSLPSGALAVTVTANLPAEREGVLALGVHLAAPPRPPQRPQAVNATALIEAPADSARVVLRLTPREPAAYTFTTFAVLDDEGGAEELAGAPVAHTGEQLELSAEAFPLEFVAVAAEPALLELARVRCTLRRFTEDAGDPPREHRFELTAERPARSLALPRGASVNATLTVEAEGRDGGATLVLGPSPAADLSVGRASFREYGPQRVQIQADLVAGDPSLLIELLPEGAPETPTNITLIQLRPDRPSQEWRYFAPSPFAPGYRYRLRQREPASAAPWSELRSPFEPLLLNSFTTSLQGVEGQDERAI